METERLYDHASYRKMCEAGVQACVPLSDESATRRRVVLDRTRDSAQERAASPSDVEQVLRHVREHLEK